MCSFLHSPASSGRTQRSARESRRDSGEDSSPPLRPFCCGFLTCSAALKASYFLDQLFGFELHIRVQLVFPFGLNILLAVLHPVRSSGVVAWPPSSLSLAFLSFSRCTELAGDGPDKTAQFTGQGRDHDHGLFLTCGQEAEAAVQTLLRLQGDSAVPLGSGPPGAFAWPGLTRGACDNDGPLPPALDGKRRCRPW